MTVVRFQDLPLGNRSKAWDGDAAEKRVRKWASAQDEPNAKVRNPHVWYDGTAPGNFGSYKLLIADVVSDKLVAMPRAVMAAAAVMQGSRGGVDLPQADIPRVRSHRLATTRRWTRIRPGIAEAHSADDSAGLRSARATPSAVTATPTMLTSASSSPKKRYASIAVAGGTR